MRVLVVDDEPLARRRLARLVGRIEGAVCVGEAEHARQALSLIESQRPDVVLLDIDMPGMDGLALARTLPSELAVVFTTAHREHAASAFRLHAVDYLLKPIVESELAEALLRVKARATLPRPEPKTDLRLNARRGDTVVRIDPARVTRFYAADKYVLCQLDGAEYVLDESLNELERMLGADVFMRVHRAELVNLSRIRAVTMGDEGMLLELDDGQRARASRRTVTELKQRLGIG